MGTPYNISNITLALPQHAGSPRSAKQRLWLTRLVGWGSTDSVWQCRFDMCDDLFAAKIAEVLSPNDANRRQRLRNEFSIYLTPEKAYQSGQLHDGIFPRCYGAFTGNHADVLILDLCDGTLNNWEELNRPER